MILGNRNGGAPINKLAPLVPSMGSTSAAQHHQSDTKLIIQTPSPQRVPFPSAQSKDGPARFRAPGEAIGTTPPVAILASAIYPQSLTRR
jgi:hypothetical protein